MNNTENMAVDWIESKCVICLALIYSFWIGYMFFHNIELDS